MSVPLLEKFRKTGRTVAFGPSNVIRSLFPGQRTSGYNPEPRAHGFMLPAKEGQNFILRLLYKIMY